MEYTFTIMCGKGREEKGKQFVYYDVTHVIVFADNETAALRKARKVAPKRKYYIVTEISEKDDYQRKVIAAYDKMANGCMKFKERGCQKK